MDFAGGAVRGRDAPRGSLGRLEDLAVWLATHGTLDRSDGLTTRETAYQASQNLLNRFGREVDGIFAPNEGSTVGMTKALKDIGRAGGKVKMVGFDSGEQSVIDMKNGDVVLNRGGKLLRPKR